MSEHSIFHKPAIASTMPPNTVHLALIRDPLDQLVSAAAYYNTVHKLVNADRNASASYVVRTFLQHADKYEPSVVPDDQYKVRHHVTNMLGYTDWKNVGNQPAFDKFLHERDNDFRLVLLLERFDESMVLLRRSMCWRTKDVLQLTTRHTTKPLDDSIEDFEMEYRRYNPGDYAVYDYFARRLQQRIDDEPSDDFAAELRHFRLVKERTTAFCRGVCRSLRDARLSGRRHQLQTLLNDSVAFAASMWDAGFEVTGTDCLLMMFDPYVYRNAVKVINYPQLCDRDAGASKGLDLRWTVPEAFCRKDYFVYTIPWDSILDPTQYVHPCLE